MMAITNITAEVDELRERARMEDDIDNLTPEKAAFCLKALLVGKYVSPHVMRLTLDLAATLKD